MKKQRDLNLLAATLEVTMMAGIVAAIIMMITACSGSDAPVELDCANYCNVVRCAADREGTDRPTMQECLAECACAETELRSDSQVAINECGDASTCYDVGGCWNDVIQEQLFYVDDHPIVEEHEKACDDHNWVCSDSYNCVTRFWLLAREDLLQQRINCFYSRCDEVAGCLDDLGGPLCRAN